MHFALRVHPQFIIRLLCAATAALLIGTLANAAPEKPAATQSPVDLSTPKKAAMSFAKAVENSDMENARLSATGTDAEFAAVKGLSEIFQAIKRYEAAAIAKFGDQGKLPFPPNLSAEVAANEEVIDGDSATLINKANPDNKHPMKLKKDNGQWKVDLSSMDSETVAAGAAGKSSSAAVDAITKNVEAGAYKSAAEALAAMGQAVDNATKPAAK